MTNAGFEEPLGSDESIPGWSLVGEYEEQFHGIDDTRAHTGSKSLRMEDDNDVRGLSVVSDQFPVDPEVVYEAGAMVSVERSEIGLYVRFFDEAGNRLTNEAVWQGSTDGEFQELSHTIAAPADAVTGALLINSSTAGTAIGNVDGVTMAATDQEPPTDPEPEPFDPEEVTSQDPRITHQGTPVTSRIITNMVMGDENGRSMTYGVYRGDSSTTSPGTFVVADSMTGEIVRSLPMEGVDGVTEIGKSVDGKIYALSTGVYALWEYDPATTELRQVGLLNPESPADGYGWTMAAAEDGKMYLGSYPKGILYLFDPATDSIENLGVIDPSQQYIRGLAYDMERQVLYAGVGGSEAQIWKIKPDGTKTALLNEVDTPGAQDHSFISSFTFVGDRLFARSGLSEMLVITADGEVEYWQGDGKEMFGYHVSQRPDDPSKFIFTFSGSFWEYDSETATTRDLGIQANGYLNDSYWTQRDDPEWPGSTMIAATNDGVAKLNLQTGTSETHPIDYQNPISIQKVLDGRDSLYASGYMVGLAPFGPEPGDFGETVQSGQYESSAVRGDTMLLGAYGHGRLMEYSPGSGDLREVVNLQAEQQDRPFGLDYDAASDRAFMGTVAHYGHNQGALTIHDFTTDETTVYKEEIVEDQSVIDVLYHDGLVYVGTTIDGGLGGEPSGQTDAHFIVFDPDTGEVVKDIIPVPGDEGVTGLMVGPDGLIWGVSEDTVFKYDPETEDVVYSEALLPHRYGTNTVWAWAYIGVGSDGNVYGTNRYSTFMIDPDTMEYTQLVEGYGSYSNIDENGDLFFASGVHLFKYDVPDADPGDDRETVWFRDDDTGIPNYEVDETRTVNDVIRDEDEWENHGQFVRHVGDTTSSLVTDDVLNPRERGALISAAARSDIGQ